MRIIYNNHQKRAQLKRMLTQLDRLVREDRFQALPARERKSFIHRLRRLMRQLQPDLSRLDLRPALLGVLAALGIGIGSNRVAAQNFLPQQNNPFGLVSISSYEAKPFLVDIDGDGDLDLFSGSADGDVYYFQNTGTLLTPAFAAPVTNPFGITAGYYYTAPTLQDMDNDGDYDLFLGEGYPVSIYYMQNTGTNLAPAFAAPIVNAFGIDFSNLGLTYAYEAKPATADLDGDGDFDLIATLNYGQVIYFQNTGTNAAPAFATGLINPFGLISLPYYAAPTVGDLDGDGDFDLGIYNNTGDFNYFENTGTAMAPAFASPITNPFGIQPGYYYTGATLADLDGDSDLDLLTGIATGEFLYQENAPGSANQAPVLVLGSNQDSICTIDTLGPIQITATDPDLTIPTVTATSTNQAVIPDANIFISGTAPNQQLTAIPIAPGNAEIVVVASDSITSDADTISVNVRDCSIAIDESFFAKEFDVYPNPADKALHYVLDLHSPVNGLRVELVDLVGKVVYAEDINGGGSSFNGELNVSRQAAGVYFLRIRTELYRFNRKIVIE
jgi:hypothetical protein